MRLGPAIGGEALRQMERHLHLQCGKWDTQVGDVSVLFVHALILSCAEWQYLCYSAEQLAAEMIPAELAVVREQRYQSLIGIPAALRTLAADEDQAPAVRAMRFDFHPTAEGWRISEVNSDVPGGWLEGSVLPPLYAPFYQGLHCPPAGLDAWGNAVASAAPDDQAVALLHAPGYLEDQQVVRAFARELRNRGIRSAIVQSPAALPRGRPLLVVRFYQYEWLCALPREAGWEELVNSPDILLVNPTVSAISESKRFALVFPEMKGCETWKALLPECRDPRNVESGDWDAWVLKGCYSNTGDQIHMCADLSMKDRRRAIRRAQSRPERWVAQRRFQTLALESCRGPVHPCIGVFVVNGRAAGAYVRLTPGQVIDSHAFEAPLLLEL